ncbi:MAG: MFS transporter [Treponema sp.]|jgi:predicted MFS family arabinose efflux permease|nr:MFS transporter [Treponema sp.]
MQTKPPEKRLFTGLCIFLSLAAALLIGGTAMNFAPWNTFEAIGLPTYASVNRERIAIAGGSEKSVLVIDPHSETLLYRINAERNKKQSFTAAKFVELDDNNNLYVLDVNFGGAFEENTERLLQYSPKGKFVRELYSCRYSNEDFIITKGKISGMAYFDGLVYIIRLENSGFLLERIDTSSRMELNGALFFEYPNAFRDLVYFHINAEDQMLTATTKAGSIKQYNFSGTLIFDERQEGNVLPWTAVSDRHSIIYTDIMNNEIVRIDALSRNRTVLFAAPQEKTPYYRINYKDDTLCAASYDNILMLKEGETGKMLESCSYPSLVIALRMAWFSLFILAVLVFSGIILTSIRLLARKKLSETFKRIALVTFCIAFGSILASIIIVDEMNDLYYEKTYNDLENISRLTAMNVDTEIIMSLSVPGEYENERYIRFKEDLKKSFSQLSIKGYGVYQMIVREQDGMVYAMCDLENSVGILFPFAQYEGSVYQKIAGTKEYVYLNETTSEGSWVFVTGPIFDQEGNVAAMIETGYNLTMVQEQMRSMVVQTILIVASATIAFLLLMIEFILILNAYRKNKLEIAAKRPLSYKPDKLRMIISFLSGIARKTENEISEQKQPALDNRLLKLIVSSLARTYNAAIKITETHALPFRPELPRALVFFLFITANLASAILPLYAANLYQPLFGLPKELVITLPFIADTCFAALALLVIPLVLEKAGIKRISLIAAASLAAAHILCFIAPNTLYLAAAYSLSGFASGALLLAINTAIGAQKDERDINSGFAHFNASYLAGINVGAVFGSILAQFFPYRMVYIFSSISALLLLFLAFFSQRSKALSYMYDIHYAKKTKGKKFAALKFIFKPVVLVSLFLLLLPYIVSMNFTGYFMPVYAMKNGLTESNIGQLLLLSGLLAILFGASLCEYVLARFPVRRVIAASLLLNIGALYLFAFQVSVFMLIITIILLSVANIFVLTNIQTYYASLYQKADVSSMNALSVYSAVENFSMAAGPVVFSYILSGNTGFGMKLFASVLLICLVLFLFVSKFSTVENDASAGGPGGIRPPAGGGGAAEGAGRCLAAAVGSVSAERTRGFPPSTGGKWNNR